VNDTPDIAVDVVPDAVHFLERSKVTAALLRARARRPETTPSQARAITAEAMDLADFLEVLTGLALSN
jgi:hypothetical protein